MLELESSIVGGLGGLFRFFAVVDVDEWLSMHGLGKRVWVCIYYFFQHGLLD